MNISLYSIVCVNQHQPRTQGSKVRGWCSRTNKEGHRERPEVS